MKFNFKQFLVSVFAILLFFGVSLKADAYIANMQDLDYSIQKLQMLRTSNMSEYVKRGEIIGNRLNDFEMIHRTYISSIDSAISRLQKIKEDINNIETMSGISEKDKYAQIEDAFKDANIVIDEVNMRTNDFVVNSSRPMPTITYERFKKKFWAFYYSLGL